MNKTRVALAVLFGALGLLFGHVSDAWGVEQGATYSVLSNALLLAALVVALVRPQVAAGTAVVRGRIEPLMAVAVLFFGAALLAAYVGSGASDANPSRYLIVAAAFVPLAAIRRNTHSQWNVSAPAILLAFAPAFTGVAWIVAGEIDVWMSPVVLLAPTMIIVLFSGYLPVVSEEKRGRVETGLAMTAAFITGVTAVSSSFDYDTGAAVIIGAIMVVAGWFLGVVLRRWNYAPSRAMNWQNLVIGVWVGQFMPGAAVMTAIALVSGWTLYGTCHGIAAAVRKARERRENAAA